MPIDCLAVKMEGRPTVENRSACRQKPDRADRFVRLDENRRLIVAKAASRQASTKAIDATILR